MVDRVSWPFLAPAALLAAAGLAAGLFASTLDGLLAAYADTYPDTGGYHLALWHGLTPALALSALVLAGGAAVFAVTARTGWWRRLRLPVDGAAGYDRAIGGLGRLAVEVTGATQRGSLPIYLGTILLVLVLLGGGALLAGWPWPDRLRAVGHPAAARPGGRADHRGACSRPGPGAGWPRWCWSASPGTRRRCCSSCTAPPIWR